MTEKNHLLSLSIKINSDEIFNQKGLLGRLGSYLHFKITQNILRTFKKSLIYVHIGDLKFHRLSKTN